MPTHQQMKSRRQELATRRLLHPTPQTFSSTHSSPLHPYSRQSSPPDFAERRSRYGFDIPTRPLRDVQGGSLDSSDTMVASDGSSSITVAVRVRPFTIREAAQVSKHDDGPLFLGDGSLAGVPTPKLNQKGIRSIVKVIDDRCL